MGLDSILTSDKRSGQQGGRKGAVKEANLTIFLH